MDDDANDATVTPGKIWGHCALQGFVMMNINYCVWEHVHEAAWFIVSTHLSVIFTAVAKKCAKRSGYKEQIFTPL